MNRFFGKLRPDTEGSTAIEFGFTAPFLVAMIVGIIEFSLILFVNSLLEGSLRDAARFATTGNPPAGMTIEEAMVAKIDSATMGLLTIDSSHITSLSYDSLGDVGEEEPYNDDNPPNGQYDVGETYTDVNGNGVWDPDQGTPGVGGPCSVVVYRVQAQWPMMVGLLASSIGSEVTVGGSAAIRNEPFGANPCANIQPVNNTPPGP
jgi:Flp pilus assembly protein TadG